MFKSDCLVCTEDEYVVTKHVNQCVKMLGGHGCLWGWFCGCHHGESRILSWEVTYHIMGTDGMDHESGKISNRSAICPHDILITPHDISRNNLLDKNIQHEIVQKTFFSITMS